NHARPVELAVRPDRWLRRRLRRKRRCSSDYGRVLRLVNNDESYRPVGQLVTVELTPERVLSADPSGAVVSLVRPERIEDVRGDVCVLGSFFASAEAATEWMAAYPEGWSIVWKTTSACTAR